MTDCPIPFSDPMVRALIEGRKTQTRRLAWIDTPTYPGADDLKRAPSPWQKCAAGDRLWVRETYYQFGHWEPLEGQSTKGGRQKWGFVADVPDFRFVKPPGTRLGPRASDRTEAAWYKRLGRFMPRKFSRLTLIVEATKIERLQDISEADAAAEGWQKRPEISNNPEVHRDAARDWFSDLWEDINGVESWRSNPEVVAISFRVVAENVDKVPR